MASCVLALALAALDYRKFTEARSHAVAGKSMSPTCAMARLVDCCRYKLGPMVRDPRTDSIVRRMRGPVATLLLAVIGGIAASLFLAPMRRAAVLMLLFGLLAWQWGKLIRASKREGFRLSEWLLVGCFDCFGLVYYLRRNRGWEKATFRDERSDGRTNDDVAVGQAKFGDPLVPWSPSEAVVEIRDQDGERSPCPTHFPEWVAVMKPGDSLTFIHRDGGQLFVEGAASGPFLVRCSDASGQVVAFAPRVSHSETFQIIGQYIGGDSPEVIAQALKADAQQQTESTAVLEVVLVGREGDERPLRVERRFLEEVARSRPEVLVINLLQFEPGFGNTLLGLLVRAAMLTTSSGGRATRILAKGRTASDLDRWYTNAKLGVLFGGTIYPDLESALSQIPEVRGKPVNRSVTLVATREEAPAHVEQMLAEERPAFEVHPASRRHAANERLLSLPIFEAVVEIEADSPATPAAIQEIVQQLLSKVKARFVSGVENGAEKLYYPQTRIHWSHYFRCDQSLESMLTTFNQAGPWQWQLRDSAWYGDYLNTRPAEGVRVRIQSYAGSEQSSANQQE